MTLMAEKTNGSPSPKGKPSQKHNQTAVKSTLQPLCWCPRQAEGVRRVCAALPDHVHQCRNDYLAEFARQMREHWLKFDPSDCDESCGSCWFTFSGEDGRRRCEDEHLAALRRELAEALEAGGDR